MKPNNYLETKSKNDLMAISHTLLVETQPVLYSAQQTLQAKVGANLQLKCEARGSPMPNITWTLQKRKDFSSQNYYLILFIFNRWRHL